jgi:hypothetical protein
MNLYQQSADLPANASRNLPATARGDISSLIVRWSSRMGLIAAIAVATLPALGRDVDGRYKDSSLHDWFEHLASGKGLCCSYADGYVIQDADWESKNGHYRVCAECTQLRKHGLDRCAGRYRHHRAKQGRENHGLATL